MARKWSIELHRSAFTTRVRQYQIKSNQINFIGHNQ